MKHYSYTLLLSMLAICSCELGKIDQQQAQTLTENLLNDLKNENYSSLGNYYASAFNGGESDEKRIEKYKKLNEVMGSIQSFRLASTKEIHNEDYGNQLELVYHVVGAKVTVKETFLIIKDNGELKIIFQNIENLNPGSH